MNQEAQDLKRLLDMLPIYATRVGYRTDSTPEEQRIGEAAFEAHRAWKHHLEASGLGQS